MRGCSPLVTGASQVSRSVTGTWLQEVRRAGDGEVLARSYNTGACVNLEGRPRR